MEKENKEGKVVVRQLKIVKKIKNLPKGKKFLVFAILGVIVLLIATLLVYTFLFKKDKDKNNKPEETIIVVKDNYKYINGVLNFLNDADEVIGTYECQNKDADKCYVAYEMTDDNFDAAKQTYEDGSLVKTRTKLYYNRYAFIDDNSTDTGSIILYDFVKNEKLATYLGIKSFYNNMLNYDENNYIIIKDDLNKYGVLNLDAIVPVEIIPFNYDYLGVINTKMVDEDSKIVYRKDTKWGLLSFKNKTLATTDNEIKGYNDKYLKTINPEGLYNLYDYSNNKVLDSYTYIDVLDDYIATVDNDKKLFVYDNNLVRLMVNKLTLISSDFVKNSIFDNDNNLVSVSQSYDISVLGNILYINVYNGEDKTENTYNILEAKLSNLYDYYSYENGKLYFFSDLDKNNLIGSYTCDNENAITDTSTAFTSCFIAKDSSDTSKNLVTPIYNERFVFINDAPVLVNDTTIKVNLYDLTLKKLLGQYLKVYTYANESSTKNGIYLESNMPKYAIAVNKSSKYGMLKIDSSEVTKAVSFLYDDIKLQGTYLLGQTGSKWALLDYSGNMILDNTYVLYELYANFVAAVDGDNKLWLYDYNKKSLINEPVQLTSAAEDFSVEFSLGVYTVVTDSGEFYYNGTTGDKIES